jgi:hypothetical protein
LQGGRAEVQERPPKTERGRRDIPLGPTADKLWRNLQSRQTVTALDGYLFTVDGVVVHPSA